MSKCEAREDVYKAVDSERAYQDAGEGNSPGDVVQSMSTYLLVLERYLDKAKRAFHKEGECAALEVVRKITAVGVMCMEWHGAPQREDFEVE